MTSKTRRREERKRARGKKGSVYEEEYLVNSVRRLVSRVNDVQSEAKRLIEGLLRRPSANGAELRQLAEAVNEAIAEVVGMCERAAKGEVWTVIDQTHGDTTEEEYHRNGDGVSARPSGADGVLWDSTQEGAGQPPVVERWEGVQLLSKKQ